MVVVVVVGVVVVVVVVVMVVVVFHTSFLTHRLFAGEVKHFSTS